MASINPGEEGQELLELAQQAIDTEFGSPEHQALEAKVRELVMADEDHNRLILVTMNVLHELEDHDAEHLILWYAEGVAGEASVTLGVGTDTVHGTAQTFLCPIIFHMSRPPMHFNP